MAGEGVGKLDGNADDGREAWPPTFALLGQRVIRRQDVAPPTLLSEKKTAQECKYMKAVKL